MADETLIQFFDGKQIRYVWNEKEEKYYFAVADVVQVLTDTVDPRDYIKKMLRRDPELKSRWGTICPPTRMKAADGKYYMTQASDLKGIFRIIQSIPSKKAEPVKKWLAEVATTEISKERNAQGMKESRQAAQAGGRIAKNTRDDLERQLGHTVISSARASDYIRPIGQTDTKELPDAAEDV